MVSSHSRTLLSAMNAVGRVFLCDKIFMRFFEIRSQVKTNLFMEKNTYTLNSFRAEGPNQEVVFYKLGEDGTSQDGTTLEEMLRVSIERLQDLNQKHSCRENALAITKMQEALMWLNERTKNRIERGVEGQHKD